MFSLKFPWKIISRTALYRLYQKNAVKKKLVHLEKNYSEKQIFNFPVNQKKVIDGLHHARVNGMPVIWADEIVFSKSSIGK